MKVALIALVLGLFSVTTVFADDTATAPSTGDAMKAEETTTATTKKVKKAKKHKKGHKKEETTSTTTTTEGAAPAAPVDAAPATTN